MPTTRFGAHRVGLILVLVCLGLSTLIWSTDTLAWARPSAQDPCQTVPTNFRFRGNVYRDAPFERNNPQPGVRIELYGSMNANDLGTLEASSERFDPPDGYFELPYMVCPGPDYNYYNIVIADAEFTAIAAQGNGTYRPVIKAPNWIQYNNSGDILGGGGSILDNYFWVEPATTESPTPTATVTTTVTVTTTATVTATPTSTSTPTGSPTPSPTGSVPPTATHTETPTVTATPSETPTLTPGTGAICVVVFNDLDRDGVRDSNEPFIPGATVRLLDAEGQQVGDSITTSNSQPDCFDSVEPGTYTVEQVNTTNYPGSTTPNRVSVTVAAGATENVGFGDTGYHLYIPILRK